MALVAVSAAVRLLVASVAASRAVIFDCSVQLIPLWPADLYWLQVLVLLGGAMILMDRPVAR